MEYGDIEGRRSHTLLGISSLVIAVLMGFVLLALIVILGTMEASTPGGVDENSLLVSLLGLAIILCLLANVVGIGLGVGGMIQRRKRLTFAVLGTVLNVLILLGVVALIVFGLVIGG